MSHGLMGLIRDRQTAQGDAKTQLEGFLPGNAVSEVTNLGQNQKSGKIKEAKWGNAAYFSMNVVHGFVFGMEGLYQLK